MRNVAATAIGLSFLLSLTGCDRSPISVELQDQIMPEAMISPSTTGESDEVAIDSSTVAYALSGSRETLSFADVDGNTYFYEATYDAAGQVELVKHYMNGRFVGTAEPLWNNGLYSGSLSIDRDGAWTLGDEADEAVAWGDGAETPGDEIDPYSTDAGCSGGHGTLVRQGNTIFANGRLLVANGRIMVSSEADPLTALSSDDGCGSEWLVWTGHSLIYTASLTFAVSGTLKSGGLLAKVAWVGVAGTTALWVNASIGLYDCLTGGGDAEDDLEDPVQIEGTGGSTND